MHAPARPAGSPANSGSPDAPARRTFLFLQGPQSRFFRQLGLAVHAAGARVIKVNVCGGDVFHWPRPFTRLYRGTRADWPCWVADLMDREAVTDILLIGDRRPLNRDAICIARTKGVRVFFLEEGYLRPNYITLEPDGVNTCSQLPSTSQDVQARAAFLPDAPPYRHIPDSMPTRVGDTIRHHVGNATLFGLFPHYRTHRPYTIGWELTGWLPRYWTRHARKEDALARQAALLDSGKPFFLFPLQLDADAQVRAYSHYGVRDSIMQVLSSFACAAPRDCQLLVKNHPLDNGLINLKKFTENFARSVGIAGRTIYMDGGQGRKIMEAPGCQGVVVVNSTMGLEALSLGNPVYSLGKSIYAMPGLAMAAPENSLEEFWLAPVRPDATLMHNFVKVLHAEALVEGNFYTDAGIEAAVRGSLRRLGLTS